MDHAANDLPITVEAMIAASDAALAMDRMKGVPLPKSIIVDGAYAIGFAAGAAWALQKLKEAEAT